MAFSGSTVLMCIVVGVTLVTSSAIAFPEETGYDLSPPEASGYSYGTPKAKGRLQEGTTESDESASGKSTTGKNSKNLFRELGSLRITIPRGGIPGREYPILSSVPDTGFSCGPFPGYYADTSRISRCQVFHICQFDGRQDSFLCPNGTIFNQQYFVCDWWFNVDCGATPLYVGLNAEIGRIPETSASADLSAASGEASTIFTGAVISRPNSNRPSKASSDTSSSQPEASSATSSIKKSPQSGETKFSEGYNIPGGVIPDQLYDTPTVSKPSGLYDLPEEK